jgi:hypothetical protein
MSLTVTKKSILSIISSAAPQIKNHFENRVKDLLKHIYLVKKFGTYKENKNILKLVNYLENELTREDINFQNIESLLNELYKRFLNCICVDVISNRFDSNKLFSDITREWIEKEGLRALKGLRMMKKGTFLDKFKRKCRVGLDSDKLLLYVLKKVNYLDTDEYLMYFNTLLLFFSHLYSHSSRCRKIYSLEKVIKLDLPILTKTIHINIFNSSKELIYQDERTFKNFFVTIGTDNYHDFPIPSELSENFSILLIFKENEIIPVSLKGRSKKIYIIQKMKTSFLLNVGDFFIFKGEKNQNFKVKSITFNSRSHLDFHEETNSVIEFSHGSEPFCFDSLIKKRFIIGKGYNNIDHHVNCSQVSKVHAFVKYSHRTWLLECKSKSGILFPLKSIKDFDIRTCNSFIGKNTEFTFYDSKNKLEISISLT